jgi:hypothetical protein
MVPLPPTAIVGSESFPSPPEPPFETCTGVVNTLDPGDDSTDTKIRDRVCPEGIASNAYAKSPEALPPGGAVATANSGNPAFTLSPTTIGGLWIWICETERPGRAKVATSAATNPNPRAD